jgi:AP-2 complex subunit sigma-1
MIRFILLQNRAGRTRLSKYYVPIEEKERRKLEYEIHRLVVNRDPKHTNFLEVGDLILGSERFWRLQRW